MSWFRASGRQARRRPVQLGLGAVLLVLVFLGVCAGHRGAGSAALPTTPALRGDLAIDLTGIGELQAVRSLSLGVPRLRFDNPKIVWLVPEGSTVSAGDTLARFDASEVTRRISELESRLQNERANGQKLCASQAAHLAEMEAAWEDQRASLRLAELDTANVIYESRLDREKSQLGLQRAQLNLKQAESKLTAQRTIDDAERTTQRVNVAGLESQLRSERESLANHALVAPTSGLVVYGSGWSSGRLAKIKVGDQLYYGGTVIELPDLSEMRVASYVNEARVSQLKTGLPCEVRVDAFPDTLYRGRLTRVNVLGRELQDAPGVKVFDFEALLEGRDGRLRPGMTATVTVHVESLHGVVYAPIETVHSDAHGSYVWRQKGRRFERVPVVLGRQNDFHVVLTGGVQPGDRLALRAPAEGADAE